MANKPRGRNEGSISRRSNGMWRAQICLDGKRISTSAPTKIECLEWLREKKNQIDNGLTFGYSQTTLAEFLASWLISFKESARYTTWDQYQRMVNVYISPELGKIKVSDLKPEHIQVVYNRMLTRKVGRYTILKAHDVLRSALTYAVKIGVIPRNPCSVVLLPKAPTNEMQILDENQVNQLLMTAHGNRWHALLQLAVTTGMRQMELLGLKWVDLDWVSGTLKIERQLLRPRGVGIEFASTKTKFGRRTIKLGSKTIEVLREHYRRQQEDRKAAGADWQEYGLIFTNHQGGPANFRNVFRDYKKLLERAGLPSIRFHDLRHTAASLMLNHNVPVIVVSRRLGHAKPSITLDIYGHLIPTVQNEVAEMLDEMVTPIVLVQTESV